MSEQEANDISPPRGFLTIQEVAIRLGVSSSDVNHLIERDRLKAVKRSGRKTLVPEPALEAYLAKATLQPGPMAREAFVSETGQTPEAWIEAWKMGQIEDTPENNHQTINAAYLVLQGADPYPAFNSSSG